MTDQTPKPKPSEDIDAHSFRGHEPAEKRFEQGEKKL